MKKAYFLIAALFLSFYTFGITSVAAGPGDTIGQAYAAHLGQNNGTVTQYNEIDHYNFSSNALLRYNFSLVIPGGDLLYLYVHDKNGTTLTFSNLGIGDRIVEYGGRDRYIIKIISTEFVVFPANYSLVIEEITGGLKETFRKAKSVIEGSYTDNFELYNDEHWYNFTSAVAKEYNFSVSRDEDAYIGIYLYDSELNLLASDWTALRLSKIIITGYAHYSIRVLSSEFIVLPVTYNLTISEIVQDDGGSTSEVPDQTDPVTVTVTQDDNGANPFADLNFPTFLVIPVIVGLVFGRRIKPE